MDSLFAKIIVTWCNNAFEHPNLVNLFYSFSNWPKKVWHSICQHGKDVTYIVCERHLLVYLGGLSSAAVFICHNVMNGNNCIVCVQEQ
jgi:hypothetical protein